MSHDDFAVEPIPGLPARPPGDEKILWQGAPDWRIFARRVFHLPVIAAYFAILAGWRIATAIHDGGGLRDAVVGVGFIALLAGVTLGFFALLAWAIARSTVYTLTSRRIVMRFGVALPMTVNLPFAQIAGAALRPHPQGFGDIPLALIGERPLSYAVMWPHVRPWHVSSPEPMLRCIPDAKAVARLAAAAFAEQIPVRVAREDAPERALATGGPRPVTAAG